MTRKRETTFVSGMHRGLPPDFHREKMNNPYRSGTADWWYSGLTADLWVEYKYLEALPKRDTTLVVPDLSPLQLQWCGNRYAEGRHVRVILGVRQGAALFRDPQEWAHGLPTDEVRRRLVPRSVMAGRILAHCTEGIPLC